VETSHPSGADASDAPKAEPGREPPPAAEPYVLPQWAIQLVRVTLRTLFGWLFRLRLVGTENIPRQGETGLIVAANHQTYIDPFWVAAPFNHRLRFLAWDAVFGWPVAGPLMRWLGAWPLQVNNSASRAYRRSVQWIKGGGALVIFPEGGRGLSDGKLQPLKPGAVRLALETGAPILPVTIRGGHRVWPKDRKWPRLGRVEIVYHPPRRPAPLPGEDARRCALRETEQLSEIINSAL
jgi:1-acyl-sn-glycerol-3-phosphate acyltransferase